MDPNTQGNPASTGRLQVCVYRQTIALPVSGAMVQITPKNNPNNALQRITTNTLGQTDFVVLPAPNIAYSSDNAERPYSEYDIYVFMEARQVYVVHGAQIYPGTDALQNVYLDDVNQEASITVDAPTVWGTYPTKIAENNVKELPPALGYVVLPNPIIPEYIIVHLGAPTNTSAKNVTVPFKDYIANVACSEIYSSWPTETLRANVLAIISFTLNRVYTEWYRSKGYTFTITSLPNYDQAFNYGRTLFEEITLVVDELFTTYITKPNIRQPFFTQYCDGKKAGCPKGMSQWGSKTLGEQGLLAIDILKRYYGQDIYLAQAEQVSGVPKSFSENLQMGSSGDAVRTLQEQLNRISNNYPAINKIRVDGIFGTATRTAVETFQKAFHLPTTGIVNFASWYKISLVYVAVTKQAT